MSTNTRALKVLVACTALLAFESLSAAEGIFEINQACVADGCFAGDAPGLPVEITQPGSYRLSSNLGTDQDDTAIEIAASVIGVSIDLNGFAITGPFSCTGDDPVCTPTGAFSGAGVRVTDAINLSIHNGVIEGFSSGVFGGNSVVQSVVLEDLRISNNLNGGIDMLDGSGIVRNVFSHNNGGKGINVPATFQVLDNIVVNNGSTGIDGGLCSRNTLISNGDADGTDNSKCIAQFNTNMCDGTPCP